jgi:hypothetical protein
LKIKTKIKQERKAKDKVDVFAAITKYLDKKVYHYHNEAGKDMVEVHADWLYSYEEVKKLPKGIPPLPKCGGNLSICKPENVKPQVPFGQDEAIFRSSQLNDSCWAIDGQQTFQTKSMGVGRMVSALCLREFGFGIDLTVEQIAKVNERRQMKNMETKRLQFTYWGVPTKRIWYHRHLFAISSMKKERMDIGATTIWCCSLKTVPTFSRFSINNLTSCMNWITPAGMIKKSRMA